MAESNALINPADLIAKFQLALNEKWGYIYGSAGILWTQAKQEQKVSYMVSKYGSNWKNSEEAKKDNYYLAALYGAKWIGHMVADCSGLFTWAFAQLGGKMYHGSNTMWNSWCQHKGELKSGKRTDGKELKPGTAVFTYNKKKDNRGHVGLYIGNGTVIEAAGTQAGVCTSSVTASKWVEWGELKGVNYGAEPAPQPTPEPTPEPGTAIVTGKNVALRQGPGTEYSVRVRVATGSTVKIEPVPDDWEYVSFNGKKGFMMKQYLREE